MDYVRIVEVVAAVEQAVALSLGSPSLFLQPPFFPRPTLHRWALGTAYRTKRRLFPLQPRLPSAHYALRERMSNQKSRLTAPPPSLSHGQPQKGGAHRTSVELGPLARRGHILCVAQVGAPAVRWQGRHAAVGLGTARELSERELKGGGTGEEGKGQKVPPPAIILTHTYLLAALAVFRV